MQKGHADDADHFSVSVFTRESVVLTDTRREATTDDSDRFSLSHVFSRESVVVTDTRRKAMTDDSDCFSMSPASQRSDD